MLHARMHLSSVILLFAILEMADSHGSLVEPPSRSSMWRLGYDNPHNYNDNQLFCGGFATQYNKNGGKCGVCGDPYDGERENEGPSGKYAKNGIITRKYTVGQILHTSVLLTANHKGYFQFKLCQNDEVRKKVEQPCFDQNILPNVAGDTKLTIKSTPGYFNHSLKLPPGLVCSACILQWRYHAGNSWGVDPDTNKGCIGCGNQEEFYGCADIAIGRDVTLGESNLPSHVIPPAGPGDGNNNWNDTQNGQSGQSGCNCPCANGSATSVNFINTMCLFASYVIFRLFSSLS